MEEKERAPKGTAGHGMVLIGLDRGGQDLRREGKSKRRDMQGFGMAEQEGDRAGQGGAYTRKEEYVPSAV